VGPKTKAKSVNTNLHNNSFNNNQIMKYQARLAAIVLVHSSNIRSTQRMETLNKSDRTKLKVISKTRQKKEAAALA